MRIVGISGSLRKGSYNAKLLKLILSALSEKGIDVEEISFADIPLYNGDVEQAGIPSEVAAFKEKLKSADGIVIVSPEYNWSLPGGLKNAIDWATRPESDIKEVFHGQIVLQAGSSNGARATVRAQSHWLNVWQTLKLIVAPRQILIADCKEAFDESDKLIREGDIKQLASATDDFVNLLEKLNNAKSR